MAPTTAPTHVFAMLTTFSGVYTPAYNPMLTAPKAAVVQFVCRMHMTASKTIQPGPLRRSTYLGSNGQRNTVSPNVCHNNHAATV